MSAPVGRCVASWERGRVRIAPWQFENGFGPIFGAPKSGQEKEPGTKHPGSTHFCPQCGQFPAFRLGTK